MIQLLFLPFFVVSIGVYPTPVTQLALDRRDREVTIKAVPPGSEAQILYCYNQIDKGVTRDPFYQFDNSTTPQVEGDSRKKFDKCRKRCSHLGNQYVTTETHWRDMSTNDSSDVGWEGDHDDDDVVEGKTVTQGQQEAGGKH
ncbi:hypothetical protein C8J57DRAFT_1236588 [Mycena rebaudengoi]|nr:hypothetical protein C8J57DRAFT_1236588 [Mycena rebaudengoi]